MKRRGKPGREKRKEAQNGDKAKKRAWVRRLPGGERELTVETRG